jgi:hypothetical protein
VAEQNVEDSMWLPGNNYSRRLKVVTTPDGHKEIVCEYDKGGNKILGWMTLFPDEVYVPEVCDFRLFILVSFW